MNQGNIQRTRVQKLLHYFSIFVAVMVLLLITVGGLVNSAGASLSVPDWPTTYGENMFLYPPEKWVGGIFYEHGHRLLASFVGFLLLVQFFLIWFWYRPKVQKWLYHLSLAAVLLVIVQGILGGVTVLLQLPTVVSVSHALLAEILFLLTILIAVGTTPQLERSALRLFPGKEKSARILFTVVIALFLQIFLGALVRHTHSGLAIPDFPLAYGKIVPEFTDYHITIHFLHRIGAVVVTVLIVWSSVIILRGSDRMQLLRFPAILLLGMLGIQILLGGGIIWTFRDVLITTLHVGVGASMFGLSFLQYLLYRFFIQPSKDAGVEVGSPSFEFGSLQSELR